MKVKVDKMPTKPQECLFSCRMYHTNYVCNLSGQKNFCVVDKCKYLKADEDSRNERVEVEPVDDAVDHESYSPYSYIHDVKRTIDPKLTADKRLLEGLVGMNSEAGEALDIWKKHKFQGHDLDKEAIALELGDVLWYLTEAADALGYSLETIMKMNIKKLQERYPDGFDPERSKHRKEGDK